MFTLSKLSLVSRNPRIVCMLVNGVKKEFVLSDARTCNTGDVIKQFNFYIRQNHPNDAWNFLRRKLKDPSELKDIAFDCVDGTR